MESTGADPSNLWGNARGGSAMPTQLQSLTGPEPLLARSGEVHLRQVSHSYRTARGELLPVLADVSFDVHTGELVAVVGPSGCGKSTLLELVCGLQSPDAGTLRSAPAVLMPQRDLLMPWLSAVDNAALALRIAGRDRAHARAVAGELFTQLGLEGFAEARPFELSGGMRQRVAFMRTLLAGKPVLCLDEPFAALDAITRGEMQDWLAGMLARERRTVVLVTHDVEEAALLADRVVVFSPRPGTPVAELTVGGARPRERTGAEVQATRAAALRALAGEARA
jgi:NitT/TauT family transport system ATP-binding protein